MSTDQRLKWVQQNRGRVQRMVALGDQMQRFVSTVVGSVSSPATQRVVEQLRQVVDDEFRAHCKVVVSDRGDLKVVVDHPGRVYAMRSQWLQPLMRFRAKDRSLSGSPIRFEFGSYGTTV